ncbi:MAG: TonB-dependent receptor [Synergistaceae bacterium]|nr:TonB-dependent receptor [Synergistaceae bacterium]
MFCAAAALVVSAFMSASSGEAAVRVEGMKGWLSGSAERSLEAVYGHIPPSEGQSVKEELLQVVTDRLLLGYSVDSIRTDTRDLVTVKLRVSSPPPVWQVSIVSPSLSPPVDGWFASDVRGLADEVASLIEGVPMEALTWGDIDLRKEVDSLCAERIPGWRPSLMARTAADGSTALEVSFSPEQPLSLAISANINSSSIPAVLHLNLRDDLIKGYAPVIGVPVVWLERHGGDMEVLGRSVLEEEYLVDIAKVRPVVGADAGIVSNVDVELESRRYSARLWLAVYAGAEERYPEAGAHLGRRIQLLPRLDMELYGEFILKLDDWEMENKFGVRWSPFRNFWLGAEWSDAGDVWWGRIAMEPWSRRPYVWLRFSEDEDVNAALGYRFNDYLSLEFHYDTRFDDEWNLRALLNL